MIARLRDNSPWLSGLLGLLTIWDLLWLVTPPGQAWLVAVLGVPVTLLLPGALAVVCLGARRYTALTACFAVGFAVLLLYAVGLGANTLPQLVGNRRPLDSHAVWVLFNVVYVALAIGAGCTYRSRVGSLRRTGGSNEPVSPGTERDRSSWPWLGTVVSAVAVVAPILTVLGAVTLNNSGSNTLALRALILVIAVVAATFVLRRQVSDATLLWVIGTATLSLLLSSSMRSWYIAGQDVQHEFQVFMLAMEDGRWDIASYRDSYNACLSVTLFPVALTELLRVDGAVVFKLLDQALFVTVPLTLFCSTRRFLGRSGAYAVAILFIGLPTFSIDVPFITRQQLAFVFVALGVAAVFTRSEAWIERRRTPVFILMSTGVVLSHYSTSYLFVAGLLITFAVMTALRLGPERSGERGDPGREQLSAIAILGATAVALVWLGPVTHASGDLKDKVGASASSAKDVITQPQLVLQGLGKPDSGADGLTEYVARTNVGSASDVPSIVRSLKAVSSDAPETGVTTWVSDHLGIDTASMMNSVYYGLGTKLYLLCCSLGTLMLFSRRIRGRLGSMPVLYPVWALASGIVLGLQLILPSMAENYGLSRAFMQAFIVMAVPMVALIIVTFGARKRLTNGILITVPTGLLIVYSGLGPYVTGGLHRQLSLGNAGQYYGTVYPRDTDLAAADWVGRTLPPGSKVNTADFAAVYAYHPDFGYDFTDAGLFPFQVKQGDYVMLSNSQTRDHVVYGFSQPMGLSISPATYADSDLVYSSGAVQIFRKG